MRSLHLHIRREYGKENVDTFRQWEKNREEEGGLFKPPKILSEMSQSRSYSCKY